MPDTPIIVKRKKQHGGHVHHGGSWKVAYADFVTAMMAFFMVMWIMGLSDDMKAQIQGYFNDPLGFNKTQPRSRNVMPLSGMTPPHTGVNKPGAETPHADEQARELDIERKVRQRLEGVPDLRKLLQHVSITMTDEGLQIEFREAEHAAFFESGRAEITPLARQLIGRIAPVLSSAKARLAIAGHTDAKPYGGPGYTNWDLSADRANSVRRELAADGLSEHQFVRVEGMADTHLLIPDRPFDAANRRVTILLPFKYAAGETQLKPKDEADEISKSVGPDPLALAPPARRG